MKKTKYIICISQGTYSSQYRRVWEQNRKYYIKHDGKIKDVSECQNNFIVQ